MLKVSIVIVNYKTPELVIDAVKSVIDYTSRISYEIIVVDNASNDESKDIIQKSEIAQYVQYIQLTENVGFGRGNNAAIEIAKGEYVFLLNSDAMLQNNAIEILSDYMDLHPHTGACGANLYNPDGTLQPAFTLFFNSISSYLNRFCGYIFAKASINTNSSNAPMQVCVLFGAALMLRKKVLNEVGYFNPAFFMYAEEEELCYRICKHGYSLMNIPSAKVLHLDGKSSQLVERRELMKLTGLRIYFGLTHSYFYFLIVRIISFVHSFSRYLFALFTFNKKKMAYWNFYIKNPL